MITQRTASPEEYAEAYKRLNKDDFFDMTCAKCGGILKIYPFLSFIRRKKNGKIVWDVTTINYCKNCYK